MESNINQHKPTIKNNNTLEFWRPNQDNGIFSNFYAASVEIKGKSWPTNEHYFQAQKFEGTEKEETIRKLETPRETFQAGRERDPNFPLRKDWEQVKEDVMYTCCYAKFTQNQALKQFLLDTKDSKLIEASPRDAYWGWGPNKDGKNRLGIILMQIRDELLKQQQQKQ
ncbi:hypothetical protein PPERSA_02218 [Pseudocohnilembus persalinus]|uniref:NADAR domain-containing protein n=1 Tax=Pseudocohnilembus persalinus TaxID=266149 RepID=A0A0V0QKX6_PSEPJ|nr:hypothetical protein PPERSA_02218 [Pseudocohnilembus persalinus]|eukprot:KRX02728.1 hypothetical protein PPERSA_02218 [Pseudocohnilembus persalinus]